MAFLDLAKQAGNRLYENTAMFGYIGGMLALSKDNAKALITKRFSKRGDDIVSGNITAFDLGYALGQVEPDRPKALKPLNFTPKKALTGNDVLSMGAIAGGVNYVAAYPMSPGTSLMTLFGNPKQRF